MRPVSLLVPLLAAVPAGALEDRVMARADVPDSARKVGEVRLVHRGEAVVVQTLLATRVLPRVLAEIRAKEEANWPPGTPGREDMERYLASLERAGARLRAEREDGGDRRLRLLIELVATRDAAELVVGGFAGDERVERRPFETLPLRKTYAFRNMRLILADAFDVPEAEVERVGPLGPVARP